MLEAAANDGGAPREIVNAGYFALSSFTTPSRCPPNFISHTGVVFVFSCQQCAVLELLRTPRERDTHTMTDDEIPPMGPLVPLIDQMREITREGLPEPRPYRVKLWDDGTSDSRVYRRRQESTTPLTRTYE